MHFETILNALAVPVLVCDQQGHVIYSNGAVDGLLGGVRAGSPSQVVTDLEDLFDSRRMKQPRRRVTLEQNDGSRLVVDALVSIARAQDQPVAVLALESVASPPVESIGTRRGSVAVTSFKQDTPTSRARLLVVDDEEMVRMVICAVLAQKGYEVVEAVDGEDALRKCAAGAFDLALVDLFMPRLNGLETLQELRRLQPQLRALLLSGVADIHDFKGWESAAGVDFLQKPFDNRELTRAVEELLAKQ